MSHDAFGFPVRKYDFGKDVQLAGQSKVVGARYKMQDYLCWSRTDQVAAPAGVSVYLPFDVPPLPAGAVIRATVNVVTGAGDIIGLAASLDWLVGTPAITVSMVEAGNPGQVTMTMFVAVRGRNLINAGTSHGTFVGGGNSPDWVRNNRLAVYANEATGITLDGAFVEVFIPRIYR